MRFYPHGSGSNPVSVVSASFAQYGFSTLFAINVLSSSIALTGSPGIQGPSGICIPVSGSAGPQGNTGARGPIGPVDGPYSSY